MSRPTNRDRAADLAWLVAAGESMPEVLRRLGTTRVALERWCQRNQTTHLYARLVAREQGGDLPALPMGIRRRSGGGRPPLPEPPCGTEQKYQWHHWRGQKCDECRRAHAAHERARVRRARGWVDEQREAS